MKKLLIPALIIFFSNVAFAQKDTVGLNVPFVNNTVVYERVFDAPNAPGSLLYSNAGLWFAETHSHGGTTKLQLEDPELLRVAGGAKFSIVVPNKVLWQTNYDTYTYNFTLRIDCKDNKYRIRIYNIQDMTGTFYTPVDDMMQSLISSKSLTLATGAVIKKQGFIKCLQVLNTVIDNVMADINKNIMADNSF